MKLLFIDSINDSNSYVGLADYGVFDLDGKCYFYGSELACNYYLTQSKYEQ